MFISTSCLLRTVFQANSDTSYMKVLLARGPYRGKFGLFLNDIQAPAGGRDQLF